MPSSLESAHDPTLPIRTHSTVTSARGHVTARELTKLTATDPMGDEADSEPLSYTWQVVAGTTGGRAR